MFYSLCLWVKNTGHFFTTRFVNVQSCCFMSGIEEYILLKGWTVLWSLISVRNKKWIIFYEKAWNSICNQNLIQFSFTLFIIYSSSRPEAHRPDSVKSFHEVFVAWINSVLHQWQSSRKEDPICVKVPLMCDVLWKLPTISSTCITLGLIEALLLRNSDSINVFQQIARSGIGLHLSDKALWQPYRN